LDRCQQEQAGNLVGLLGIIVLIVFLIAKHYQKIPAFGGVQHAEVKETASEPAPDGVIAQANLVY
jgi:hypothetical protein